MVTTSEIDWDSVRDSDIPVKRIATKYTTKKQKNYFHMYATDEVGIANALCRNCLAVYALLSTAKAMHPHEEWHTLPHHQVAATGLSRYQIRWAMKKMEEAGMVQAWRQPGCKTRYKLIHSAVV